MRASHILGPALRAAGTFGQLLKGLMIVKLAHDFLLRSAINFDANSAPAIFHCQHRMTFSPAIRVPATRHKKRLIPDRQASKGWSMPWNLPHGVSTRMSVGGLSKSMGRGAIAQPHSCLFARERLHGVAAAASHRGLAVWHRHCRDRTAGQSGLFPPFRRSLDRGRDGSR